MRLHRSRSQGSTCCANAPRPAAAGSVSAQSRKSGQKQACANGGNGIVTIVDRRGGFLPVEGDRRYSGAFNDKSKGKP